MRQKSGPEKQPAEDVIKDIRRVTRRHFSAEDKIRIVLEGLRGEDSIAELCRREGIVQNLYYRWSKDFLEAVAQLGRENHESQNATCALEFVEAGPVLREAIDELSEAVTAVAQRSAVPLKIENDRPIGLRRNVPGD